MDLKWTKGCSLKSSTGDVKTEEVKGLSMLLTVINK